MQNLLKVFMSPMAFVVGFVWPLLAQTIVLLGVGQSGLESLVLASFIAMPLGIMAQLRGSWIWIK